MKKQNKDGGTPKITDADKTQETNPLLEATMRDFDDARKYVKDNYQSTWEKCFKAYNLQRVEEKYEGVSKEAGTEVFTIVESLKSSIAGSKPKFKFLPLIEEQRADTEVLNALVDFYWSCNNMTEKALNWVGDMIVYGNGVLMVSWDNNKPLIQHIPLSDFFVDPAATHMNRPEEPGYPRYAGYRYLTSVEELEKEMTVDENGEVVPMYKNLDKIEDFSGDDDHMDKDRKEAFIGSTYGKEAYRHQVEVIVYYTRYKKVVIANKTTIIWEGKNPFQKDKEMIPVQVQLGEEIIESKREVPEIQGFLPFAILRNYVDSNLFFARGDVEIIIPSAESMNDTASQKRDNLAYVINNMWQIDPRFKHLTEQIESEPGAVFPIPRGALNPIEKQDMTPSADSEIERQRQQMRAATAADAAVQGTSQRFSRTTATEVQAQLNQASARFTTKVQNLEDEGFAQLARIIYKMIQIFVDNSTAVRILGPRGVEWKDYNPQDYKGEYEPRVVLESTARSEAAAMVQQMQVAAQFSLNNPLVNQQAFLRKFYEVLFPDMPRDEIENILSVPQPIMGPGGQAIDPALAQADALVTPDAARMLRGEGGDMQDFGDTERGRATQTGRRGGGGADTGQNNIRRVRSIQPSTILPASSRPR